MTEAEKLETTLKSIDESIVSLGGLLYEQQKLRDRVQGQLNRARRLEREELQNAERKS